MVEYRPWLTVLTYAILILGCILIAFPIYTTFVASTHTLDKIASSFPVFPGGEFIENYRQALTAGSGEVGATVVRMMINSAVMAFGIALWQDLYFTSGGIRHCLFSLSLSYDFFLDDFYHSDAAGGGSYFTHV